MAGQAQQEKARGGGTGKLVMTGLLMLPVVAVLLPSFIVLTINMMPTIVAYVVDKSREKYLAITVGLLNICGTLPALAELWREGQSNDAALDIAGNPFHWLMAYGASGIAWLVYLGLPPILEHYYGITSRARFLNHQRKQDILVEAWGEDVRGEISDARDR